jgi:hypothetical protein
VLALSGKKKSSSQSSSKNEEWGDREDGHLGHYDDEGGGVYVGGVCRKTRQGRR